jgi:hypothetical protein
MTKDEIVELTRQAGGFDATPKFLERFAALVAEKATEQANARQNASWALMCKKMVAAEREACAKAAEDFLTGGRSPLGRSVAAAIRARAEND